VHDEEIAGALEGDDGLLPEACKRKYAELDDLFCLGCHAKEPDYNKKDDQVLVLCKSYVMRLWNVTDVKDLDKPTSRFDNCGFKAVKYLEPLADGKSYVMPSQVLKI
jgi:hypothetical protein